MKSTIFSTAKYDIPAGLVVFLVALPLCLGISLASGAPFFSGIIAGIVGGIVIGSLSNSNLSVSGPAAGMAALVLASITNIGDFRLFLCAVVIAGIIQLLMGLAKLGGIANYFPSSVVKGMLTSIGILIIAKQIPHAFGYDRDEKGHLTQLFPFGDEDWHDLLKPFQHIDLGVFIICLLSIFIMLLWERPFIKKHVKFIPGALVAVLVSIMVNEIFKAIQSPFIVVEDHLVSIKGAANVSEFLGFFTSPDFSGFTNSKVIMAGFTIAIIATLETLLSIEAIDNIDPQRNVTDTNRELFAQGIGNAVSGLIGGLPITSVIVRSSANVHSGGKSKLSTIFHGTLLLIAVAFIPALLNLIPLSALAAVLILTGYKLCNFSVFKKMYNSGKYVFLPFIITTIVIIGIDLLGLYKPLKGEGLLVGVAVGLVTAIFAILHSNLKNSHYLDNSKEKDDVRVIHLSEEVSFLNKGPIRELLNNVPANCHLTIDATKSYYIDYDVKEMILEFQSIKAPIENIKVTLIGFEPHM